MCLWQDPLQHTPSSSKELASLIVKDGFDEVAFDKVAFDKLRDDYHRILGPDDRSTFQVRVLFASPRSSKDGRVDEAISDFRKLVDDAQENLWP